MNTDALTAARHGIPWGRREGCAPASAEGWNLLLPQEAGAVRVGRQVDPDDADLTGDRAAGMIREVLEQVA